MSCKMGEVLRRIWSWITGTRYYDVLVTSKSERLRAGECSYLCTIQLQINEGELWDGKEESLPTLCKPFSREFITGIDQWREGENGKPEKIVYVTSNKASENNKLEFCFSSNRRAIVRSITNDGSKTKTSSFACLYSVLPSHPVKVTGIRIYEHRSSDPFLYEQERTLIEDVHGEPVVIQRNAWYSLCFTLEDRFGNNVPWKENITEVNLEDMLGNQQALLERGEFMSNHENGDSELQYRVIQKGEFRLNVLARSLPPDSTKFDFKVHLLVVAQVSCQGSKFDILHKFRDLDDVPAIFVEGGAIKCKFDLRDEEGNSYRGPFKLENLKVYLNDEKMRLQGEKKDDKLYFFYFVFKKSGKTNLAVTINEKIQLKCPESFYIFGNEPFWECCDRYKYGKGVTVIVVTDVGKFEVIGPDYSLLNNINRALRAGKEVNSGRRDLGVEDFRETGNNVEIVCREETIAHGQVELLQSLVYSYLSGLYYRGKATEFDEKRKEWKERSQVAYENRNGKEAQRCSEIKTEFGNLMSSSNRLARDLIFGTFNKGRQLGEIDLHGLLVADEKSLQKFYEQERGRYDSEVIAQEVGKPCFHNLPF